MDKQVNLVIFNSSCSKSDAHQFKMKINLDFLKKNSVLQFLILFIIHLHPPI